MKIAVCIGPSDERAVAMARRMAAAQIVADHQVLIEHEFEHGAVVVVDNALAGLATTLMHTARPGRLVVSTGVPLVPKGHPRDWFAAQARKEFDDCVAAISSLDGAHCTLVVDEANDRAALVSDVLGMQPMYVLRLPGYVLLATEPRAFTASGVISPVPDPVGWGAFMSFGHVIAERSMLRDVHRVEPATVVDIDTRRLTWSDRQYWNWPEDTPEIPLGALDSRAMVHELSRDVRRYMNYSDHATVLLSGGFDSRLITALVIREGGRPTAVSVQHSNEANGADGRFASKLAHQFGLDHTLHGTPSDFYLSASYLNYVRQNQCATQSLHLFIAQVAQHLQPAAGAVWEGVFPGPCIRAPSSFLRDRKRTGIGVTEGLWYGAERVFSRQFLEAARVQYSEALEREMDRCGYDAIGARRFFVHNRTRNRTAPNPLTVYANAVIPFTPGVNRILWEINVNVSGRQDSKAGLYYELFQRHFPEYLSLPVISSGTLYGRHRWDPAYLRERSRLGAAAMFSYVKARAGIGGTLPHRPLSADRLVSRVLAHTSPDSPWLDADEVAAVKRSPEGVTPSNKLLFYWQVWNWIMEGTLTDELIQDLTQST